MLAISFHLINGIVIKVNKDYLSLFKFDKEELIYPSAITLEDVKWVISYPFIDGFNNWASSISGKHLIEEIETLESKLFNIKVGDQREYITLTFGNKVLYHWNKEDWIEDPDITVTIVRLIQDLCLDLGKKQRLKHGSL